MADTHNNMSVTANFYYKVDADAGMIYIGETKKEMNEEENYMEYELKGNKLTMKEFGEEGEALDNPFERFGLGMPWVFTKR